jgi:ATP-binding cassette subfamily B protein
MNKPTIPSSITKLLGTRSNCIVFAQKSDLSISRRFGESFLIMTDKDLLSISDEKIIREIPLGQISEVKTDELSGGGRISVVSEGVHYPFLYYSNHYVPIFSDLVNSITFFKENGEIADTEFKGISICKKCNSPLPDRESGCPRCVPKMQILLRILDLAKPYKLRVFLLMVVTAIGVVFQVLPPYLTKKIVDDVIGKGHHSLLLYYTGAMVCTGILYLITRLVNLYLTSWISAQIVGNLRSQLHSTLQYIRLKYFTRREPGEIIGRVMHDTGELQQFLVEGIPFLLINSISFIVVAVILMKISWSLALFVFVPVPVLVIGSSWFWKKLHPLFLRQGSLIGHLHSVLNESIQGLRVVKACSKEKQRVTLFNSVSNNLAKTQVRTQRIFGGFNEVMFWVMSLGVACVWFIAVRIITSKNPTLTIGDLLAFVGYIWLFYGPLQWYSVVLNWMTHAFSGAERIFEVIDTSAETGNDSNAISLSHVKGEITFKDVHFSYEQGKEIIKGISFRIKPGEVIGLVGKSGSGKSTLINLLSRFYLPDSGQILLDNVPLQKLVLSQLRKNMGIVMQESFLFNASIAENIAYGMENASFKEIVEAAKNAFAHDFIIRKPDGYDTLIGESGVRLSGGERQRITIARAILHNPPILILDEATSSVDTSTEQQIQNAIAELIKGRTTIAIAHRLSTLRNAHRLIVLADGLIVESGTHEELIDSGGTYSQMVKSYSQMNALQSVVWGG